MLDSGDEDRIEVFLLEASLLCLDPGEGILVDADNVVCELLFLRPQEPCRIDFVCLVPFPRVPYSRNERWRMDRELGKRFQRVGMVTADDSEFLR
jgi:hypothetical protein